MTEFLISGRARMIRVFIFLLFNRANFNCRQAPPQACKYAVSNSIGVNFNEQDVDKSIVYIEFQTPTE